jgi:hypothetical protein
MKRLTDNELDALETVWSDIRGSDRSPHFWPGNSFDPAVQFMFMAHNALPALLAEVRELRRKEGHMRRFAASMADDGDPVLLGFAYHIQVILDGNNGGGNERERNG